MELTSSFEELVKDSLGTNAAQALFDSFENEPLTSIRVNGAKLDYLKNFYPNSSLGHLLDFAEDNLKEIEWVKDGFFLKERENFTLSPLFQGGAYYVQDSSSMFLECLKSVIANKMERQSSQLKVLDLCASPGGKSTHIISMLNELALKQNLPQPYIVCNEPVSKRVGALRENLEKWGYSNVVVTSFYPNGFSSGFKKFSKNFDIILTDVPCSGEGMFRKSSTALENWSLSNVKKSAFLQREILSSIWQMLSDGALLIYSTCTYNHFENADNVEFIIDKLGAENICNEVADLAKASGAIPIPGSSFSQISGFQYVPGIVLGEGQFFSLLRKGGKEESSKVVKYSPSLFYEVKGKDVIPTHNFALSIEILELLKENLLKGEDMIKVDFAQIGSKLSKEGRGKQVKENHSFTFRVLDLPKELAISYLRKENFVLNAPLGYILLTYKNLPIGFVKNLGSRFNNLLPNNKRILISAP